jgi:hypothetical protein
MTVFLCKGYYGVGSEEGRKQYGFRVLGSGSWRLESIRARSKERRGKGGEATTNANIPMTNAKSISNDKDGTLILSRAF